MRATAILAAAILGALPLAVAAQPRVQLPVPPLLTEDLFVPDTSTCPVDAGRDGKVTPVGR